MRPAHTPWTIVGLLAVACSAGRGAPPRPASPGGSGGPATSDGAAGGAGTGTGGRGGNSSGVGGAAAGTSGQAGSGEPDAAPVPPLDARAGSGDARPSTADAGGSPGSADGATGVVPSAGCAPDVEPLAEGEGTIAVGGVGRRYLVRLPTGYGAGRPWPLVLGLHSNGPAGMSYWDGGDASARPLRRVVREKAILVLPQSLPGGDGFDWRDRVPQELAYFEALLARLKSRLCVDTGRIFSMGFSGGGSFSGVLGCMRRDIRAIAVAGSVTYFDPRECVGTPAAWVAISAGDLDAGRERFRDTFRTRATCQATTTRVSPADCVAYACPPATPIHYCPYPGGHAWPPFGTEAVWDFFARF